MDYRLLKIGMVIDIGYLKLKLEHLESTETMFIIIDNQEGTRGQGCTLQLYFLLLMWCRVNLCVSRLIPRVLKLITM